MPIVEPHGEIWDPLFLLDPEFGHSLSEDDKFLVDDDLESEDLVWEVEGLVIDPLTELRHDNDEDLPRGIASGESTGRQETHDHGREHIGSERETCETKQSMIAQEGR